MKKIKIKWLKRLKRLIIALSCMIVIVCSVFSVSAATQTTEGPSQIGDFKISYVNFHIGEIYINNEWVPASATWKSQLQLDGERLRVQIYPDDGLVKGTEYTARFVFECTNSAYFDSDNSVNLDWEIWQYKDRSTFVESDTNCYRSASYSDSGYVGGDFQTSNKSIGERSDTSEKVDFSFNENSLGHSYKYYWFDFNVTCVDESYSYLAFYFIMPEINVKTSAEITTGEITNGGTDYEEVDGSQVNDYTNAENELNNSINESKENTTSFLNNFGNVLVNTKIQRGLLFVSALFKEFFAINWLSNILTFGLSLGSFAFIIGATMIVVNMRKK